MASPAAILQVMVEANTRSAMTNLTKFNNALERTDRSSATATTRTTNLGKATRTAGSYMRSAAGYAASAAAAYISIAQAKEAVTVTQDLAKTTAGLNRNLGLSVKTASQWGAVAKSRDVDAKSLTMSFTTLSRRLVDTADALKEGGSAASTAYAPFQRIGISQEQIIKGSQDLGSFLPTLANAFGKAAGGAERQASAQELLGRGYQSILPLFADGAKGLEEQQKWADKYGATLNNETLKAQMDLVAAQRESKVAILGLQVSFAKYLTPALERANDVLQRVAAIIGSDKLTAAEKFEKLGRIIGKWADKAYDAFVLILPKMVSAAGEKAPEIAKALVQGFLGADIWGKLLLGGWLFTRLGGAKVFMAEGTKAGKFFGKGWVLGLAIALPAIGIEIGTWIREHKGDIIDFGKKIGEWFVNGMIDVINFGIRQVNESMDKANFLGKLGVDAPNIGEIGSVDFTKVEKATVALGELIDKLDKGKKAGKDFNDGYSKAVRQVADASDREIGKNAVQSLGKLQDTSRGMGRSVRSDLSNTVKDLDKTGDATRDLGKRGSKNFDGMRKVVDNLGGAWGKGLDLIGSNTKNLLDKLKVNFNYDIAKGGKTNPIDKGASFFQRGGPINMGAPSGDTVPAMLERGEYVLNRNAVSRLGKDKLDAINFGHAPRFQKGGSVIEQALGPYSMGPIQYDPNHAGSNSHLHLDFFTQAQAIAYGKKMQGMGWNISEYSGPYGGFGGLTTSHQSPGHYDGTAFDANTAADETRAEVEAVVRLLGGGTSGAMVDKIKRVLLEGPKGPLRTGGQAALDKARAAANALIKKASASSVGGGVNAAMYNGPLDKNFGAGDNTQIPFNAAAMLAEKAGLPGITYAQIAIGESNLTPGAVSPDGGYGLWQMTPRVQSAATVSAWERIGSYFNPWNNAQQAKYLAGSGTGVSNYYGIGAVTDWNKHYTGPMKFQKGGLVQRLAKGGQAGKPGLKITPPSGMGLQVTGPASFPGWSQANSAASLAAALTTKLNEIASLDETLSLEQMLADRDGVFTAAEIQSQIALNAKLLPVLTAARDIAKAGAATVFGGLSVAKGPNRAALIDMAPGFTDAITEMQGVTGKGGRIFETWMEIARLKSTAPDVPGARGSVLDAIESQIALAGLTPELTDDIAGYTALVHYWETLLASLQSSGAPFGDIGSAASSLKSARDALAALTGTTDGGGSSIESDINALKLAQAMDTIRRLNVGIAQNSVFAGTFATGGTIPNGAWGIAGERGPEIIHGPATVHSNSDSQSMLSPEVRVVIEDNRTIVSVDGQVEAIVDNKLNQIARSRSYAGAGRL